MAVQARHVPHDFPALGGSAFLDECCGCVYPAPARIRGNCGFVPRKRPRVVREAATGGFLEDQRVVLPQAVMQGLQSRAVGSGAASTGGSVASGESVSLSQGLLSWMYHQEMEIDALVRLESERMRAGLEEARRRHARALLAAAERAASGRLRAAEAELERALRRNAELEEKARHMGAECQAWMAVARSHEAVAAGLRGTLDQLLRSPCIAPVAEGEGEAEDARSCCFEAPAADAKATASPCKSCGGGGEACVLLLPCRHLCLCRACEAAVGTCPVCAVAKNASLHVLLS